MNQARWKFVERAEIAQLVEHHLAKVGVAGPSPVFRSIYTNYKTQIVKAIDNSFYKEIKKSQSVLQ